MFTISSCGHDKIRVEKKGGNQSFITNTCRSELQNESINQSMLNLQAYKEFCLYDSIMIFQYDSLINGFDFSIDSANDPSLISYYRELKQALIKSQIVWLEERKMNSSVKEVEYANGSMMSMVKSFQKTRDTRNRIQFLSTLNN